MVESNADVVGSRLQEHVRRLCEWIRPAGSPDHLEACGYVHSSLDASGWVVERQPFEATFDDGRIQPGVNLVARHPAFGDDALPRLCIGAHYDTIPNCAGADDNASAVACLLELARTIPGLLPETPKMEVELVGFDLEELGMLGGADRAARLKADGTDLRGMASLEMLGYRDPTPGAQQLPRALEGQYPDTGDFIAIIGNQVSGPLIEGVAAGMSRVEGLPVETLQVPDNGNPLQATRLSDHSPFWDAGFPAVMITDTSFMRNPHYHTPGDTPDTLDYAFLHDVSRGVLRAVVHLLEVGLPAVDQSN